MLELAATTAPASQPLQPGALMTGKANASPEELQAATQKFEAIFLRQFIGQALKPLLHDTPGSQVAGAGIYQQMVSEVIAENLSQGGNFGFSSMLQAQLTDKAASAEDTTLSNKSK